VTAALAFQLTSLVVSILSVPTLLLFLDHQHYLIWIVFTTIGGLTLQLEAAIQTLLVRRIAREFAAESAPGFGVELAKARGAYATLSWLMLLVIGPLGAVYIVRVVQPIAAASWLPAWIAFVIAYAVNYRFGPNNVLLLATDRVSPFFSVMAITRAGNYAATLGLLIAGWSILGVSLSFAASVAVTCLSIAIMARRVRAAPWAGHSAPAAAADDDLRATPAGLARFAAFSIAGYVIYRGAVMIAISVMGGRDAASYSLAVQAFGVLAAIAIIPLQTRLSQLAKAAVAGDRAAEAHEIAIALLFATAAVVAATGFLAVAGDALLAALRSRIALPSASIVGLLGVAFWIEAVIMIFVNQQIVHRQLGFVRDYVVVVAVALGGMATALALGSPVWVAMLLIPILLQGGIGIPLIVRRCAASRGQSVAGLLVDLGRGAGGVGRRLQVVSRQR
jgi:hypothetical protein